MAFTKGHNHSTGRPKGSQNKVTREIKQGFEALLHNNVEKLQADLDALEPKDRLQALTNLSKYILPTLKQSEVSLDAQVNGVSDEVVGDILEGLKRSKK